MVVICVRAKYYLCCLGFGYDLLSKKKGIVNEKFMFSFCKVYTQGMTLKIFRIKKNTGNQAHAQKYNRTEHGTGRKNVSSRTGPQTAKEPESVLEPDQEPKD